MAEKQDTRFLSKDFIKNFIDLYKKHECLWKIKAKEYLNKHLKNEAYEELVDFCKHSFPNADVKFVKNKIQSLRNSFRKEMRKVNESKRSGKGSDDVYGPVLWYYKLLLFTKDQEIPDDSIETISENVNTEVYNEESVSNDHEGLQETEHTEVMEETETVKTKAPPVPVGGKTTKAPEKRKRRNVEEDFLQKCLESFKQPCESTTINDEYTAVGLNLSAKLRIMNFSQRILAESLVQQVITKGLFNELTRDTVIEERGLYNNTGHYGTIQSSYTSTPLPSPLNPDTSSNSATQYYENVGDTLHFD